MAKCLVGTRDGTNKVNCCWVQNIYMIFFILSSSSWDKNNNNRVVSCDNHSAQWRTPHVCSKLTLNNLRKETDNFNSSIRWHIVLKGLLIFNHCKKKQWGRLQQIFLNPNIAIIFELFQKIILQIHIFYTEYYPNNCNVGCLIKHIIVTHFFRKVKMGNQSALSITRYLFILRVIIMKYVDKFPKLMPKINYFAVCKVNKKLSTLNTRTL